MSNKNIVFSAAVRGFHIYKSIWKPEEGAKLICYYDDSNSYDMFSIKIRKHGEEAQKKAEPPLSQIKKNKKKTVESRDLGLILR